MSVDRISKLKDYLRESPDDAFLQHALALEFIKSGDDETAKQLFEDILGRNPAYIGSYYHLGKLLIRGGETESAMKVYIKGMEYAKEAGDQHALSELQAAKEDLEE